MYTSVEKKRYVANNVPRHVDQLVLFSFLPSAVPRVNQPESLTALFLR